MVYEKFWDCKQCGHKHIRGGIINCPCCGKTRGSDTIFYKDENNMNYLDEDEGQIIRNQGRDWDCAYCHSMNKGSDNVCINCGAERKESLGSYDYLRQNEYECSDSFLENNKEENTVEKEITEKDSTEKKSETENNNILNYLYLHKYTSLLGLLSAVAIFMFIYLLIPKWNTLTVLEKSWQTNIEIQQYIPVKESGWSVPAGGRVYDKKWEFKKWDKEYSHTEQVLEEHKVYEKVGSHKEIQEVDLGNGYSDAKIVEVEDYDWVTYKYTVYRAVYNDVKVYDWKYYYEIDKWVYARTEQCKGTGNERVWPEYSLAPNERVYKEYEEFIVRGEVDEKEIKYLISSDVYESLDVKHTYEVYMSIGNIIKIRLDGKKVAFR